MAWTDNNDLYNTSSNDSGLTIDQEGVLTHESLDDEGIDFELDLDDLIDNPYRPLVAADPVTKKIPIDLIPSVLIGKRVVKNTIEEMLALNLGDTPPGEEQNDWIERGQVCSVLGTVRASFMLLGSNPNLFNNWGELVAKFTSWENVQNKPTAFNPTYHEHNTIYPRLINGKIPSQFLPSLNLGERYKANSLNEMLSLPARSGDICVREDEEKIYLLVGVNGLLPNNTHNWVYLSSPVSGVQSVNGENGIVSLDYSDLGAAPENHNHIVVEIVDTTDPDIKYSVRANTNGTIAIYKNDEFYFDISNSEHNHDDSYSDINHNHNDLYSDKNHTHDNLADSNHEHNTINTLEGDAVQVSLDETGLTVFIDENNIFEIASKNHTHDNLSNSNHEHNNIQSLEGHNLQFAMDSEDFTIVIDQVNGFVVADKNQIFDEFGNFKTDKIQTIENENIKFQWDGTDLKFSIDGGVFRPFA